MTNLSDTLAALKPCPFCGGEARSYFNSSCDCCGGHSGVAHCQTCEAEIQHCNTEAEAIAAWNTRTGQLVPVPSVEVLARAMAEQANDYDGDVLQWQCWADSATAVIAAMQEGRE